MSDSLRDQLLGLGFKPAPASERKPAPQRGPHKGGAGKGDPVEVSSEDQAALDTIVALVEKDLDA